jgi:DNA-binding IscR family transcriptional regulator
MNDTDHALAVASHHSAEEILAHAKFPLARTRFIDGILALYEGETFLTRLMGEAARGVIFLVILCLDAGHDPDDEATWLTLKRLKQQMAQYGLSSPRHIENTVALLAHNGFVESVPSQRDRRLRLLTPTAKMLSHDRDWLAANYRPLQVMFPDPGYGAVTQRDPAFRRALRRTAMGFLGHGAQILGGNPDMMLFHARDAGVLILFKLAQMAGAPDGRAVALDHKHIGARFGVSRTHVQKILQDAARAGLVAVSGRGGRSVALTPRMGRALDRFTAESMSGHDMLFNIAQHQVTAARRMAS